MDNPESTLTAGPKPKFSSRFESHPVNSVSLVALISGGAIQMPERSSMTGGRGRSLLGARGNMGARQDNRSFGGFGRGLGGSFDRFGQGRSDRFNTDSHDGGSSSNRGPERGLGAMRGGLGGPHAGPLGSVQKVVKKDVLYLLIVDMPSDAELGEAQDTASELLSAQRLHQQ